MGLPTHPSEKGLALRPVGKRRDVGPLSFFCARLRRSGPRSGNGGVASPGLGTETASQVSHAGGTESSTARMVRYGTLARYEKPAAQCRSKLITI